MPQAPLHQPLIALVEDEEHIAQGLIFNLEAEGYRVHHEADGESALLWLLSTPDPPAAILLDVMLPRRDGFSILRELRDAGRFTPVLMLTARGRSEDVVHGFTAGADDYLPKPFDLAVLFARLSALLRRAHWQQAARPGSPSVSSEPETAAAETYTVAGRTLDFDQLEIRPAPIPDAPGGPNPEASAEVIHLTVMEADLLRYLVDRPNKIVSRKEILENVWRVHEDTDTRAIDNFIVRLRRYLEPNPTSPKHLLTVRGVGYRFVPEP